MDTNGVEATSLIPILSTFLSLVAVTAVTKCFLLHILTVGSRETKQKRKRRRRENEENRSWQDPPGWADALLRDQVLGRDKCHTHSWSVSVKLSMQMREPRMEIHAQLLPDTFVVVARGQMLHSTHVKQREEWTLINNSIHLCRVFQPMVWKEKKKDRLFFHMLGVRNAGQEPLPRSVFIRRRAIGALFPWIPMDHWSFSTSWGY